MQLEARSGKLELFTSYHCQPELNATQNWTISFKFTVIVVATDPAPSPRSPWFPHVPREGATSGVVDHMTHVLRAQARSVVWPLISGDLWLLKDGAIVNSNLS